MTHPYRLIPFPPVVLLTDPAPDEVVVDDSAPVDGYDRTLLDALDLGRTTGVWRAWRIDLAVDGTASATRVYLVESAQPAEELPALAERARQAIAASGHAAAVDVHQPETPLIPYRWTARANFALLWAAAPAMGFRHPDPDGAHEPLDGDEMLDALAYLEGAPLVTDTMHTDGTWIWPAAATDRLRRLGALPDPAFAAHIRDAGRDPAPVGAVTLHRALADLVRTRVAPR
ncbi:hypothetical protein [Actinoplanes auranticolor]|uniref:Uncharacterized protein n=1 Tax=Actinoplanes auranticolor TaxID=47988 RepID=A0A919SUX9_9ACTN|nr:hypothetical protein [Actinoplanes auranticolor]GIM77852.1 hypothetical protein Aau02nite_77980 [Actinoplanes auranticolor]